MRFLNMSRLAAVVLTLVVVLSLVVPTRTAMGWGAVYVISEVHQAIMRAANDFLQLDNATGYTTFPDIEDIVANDGVNPVTKTGPGPDGATSNSPWSEHWYNADAPGNKGRTPTSVAERFITLSEAIMNGESGPDSKGETPAHAASWAAHFLADIETPYHTNGASLDEITQIYFDQGGPLADEIILEEDIVGSLDFCYSCALYPDWDFKDEIEAFLAKHEEDQNADWFDPWYFNGETDITSSHVLYEGGMGNITDIPPVTSYSADWKNGDPSFIGVLDAQYRQAMAFTKLAAENSRATQIEGFNNPAACVARAAQRVATLWRASFPGVNPELSVSVPDAKQPQKLKVTAILKNRGNGNCTDVRAKLSLTGGVVSDGKTTKTVDNFGARASSKPVSWTVEIENLSGVTLNVETAYAYSQPDLQYASTKLWTGKINAPETETTTETEPKTTSVIILFNGSEQMGKITHTEGVPMLLRAMQALPDSVIEVAIYAYGESPTAGPCSVWGNPFMTRSEVVAYVNSLLNVKAETRGTAPLAQAITQCGNVLRSQGKGDVKVIVLMSPTAKDTCGGDPIQAARDLVGVKIKTYNSPFVKPVLAAEADSVSLQVIGIQVSSSAEEQGLKDLAAAGNGKYFSADNVDQMSVAIEGAIKAGEKSGSFFDNFQVQPWWFAVGAVIALFVIVLAVSGRKRRAQPVTATTGSQNQIGRPVNIAAPPPVASNMPSVAPLSPLEKKALFCPKCGSQTYQGAAFCVHCGSSLALSTPMTEVLEAVAPAGVFCPHCGTGNGGGSVFCNKCGAAIHPGAEQAQMATTYAQPAQSAMKKSYWAYWLLPIFFAIVGGLIAWAALKNENPSTARKILMLGLLITMLIFYAVVQNIT